MEVKYAVFILFLYIILVLLGVLVSEYVEKQKGRKKTVRPTVLSDREKRGKLNELLKPLGFAYDGRQDIFYSREDGWQRKFGGSRMYDGSAAAMNMIIDCEPIYFEYEGENWLIEFWKGQYGICTGAEVGVFHLPYEESREERLFHDLAYRFVDDENTICIRTTLWKKGRQLYSRRGYHWWLTGFVMGEYSRPSELEMNIELTLKDTPMRDAFLQGLYRAGYRNEELSSKDNTVWVHFARPHTRQPVTRTLLFTAVRQWENRRKCRLYEKVTKEYANAYDRLNALNVRAPELRRMMETIIDVRIDQGGE